MLYNVARTLGISYLWIDALCIIQNCESELEEQIHEMGDIYAGSSFTVFAASGLNSDTGLGVQRDGRARKPTKIELRAELEHWVLKREGFLLSFGFNWKHSEKPWKGGSF